MKVQITRKDNGILVKECVSWDCGYGESVLRLYDDNTTIYACTDWLDCEVIDE